MVPAGSSLSTLEQTLTSSLLGSGLTSAVSSAGRLPVFDRGGMLYIGPNSNVGAQVLPTRPGFFAAMGIPILQGRDLRDDDVDTVVVSETLARRMWPGQSPVGRQLSLGGPASRLVVGVAQDVRESFDPEEYGIGVGAARLYLPLAAPEKEMTARPQTLHLVMQCRDACDVLADTATSIVEAAGATVVDISPLQAGRDRLLAQTRFRSSSAATAASCCLVLAVVAVYGAVRRVTSTRLRELTIRMALGATPAQARWDILRHGVLLVTTGTVAGALAAWTLLSLVRPWLHGVAPSDPASFAVATLVLAAGGVLATGGPAWRMGRLDPKQLLGG
jgi:putative ABC transport system permease protein